jgi:hypothetical protein
VINSSGVLSKRALGSNAFSSTTIPTNAVLTSGNQTIAGEKTFSSNTQVDKTLSVGSGSSRFIFHSGTSLVTGSGTSNATEIDWKDSTHYIPSLAYAFRVKLVVTGTGTDTGASYIVYYNNTSSAWVARYINRAGITSNHAQLTMVTDGTGTYMAAYHTHSGGYNIRYWVETFDSGDQDMDAHAFGSDFQWQRSDDTLIYADGNVVLSGGALAISGDGSNAATLTESGAGDFEIHAQDDLRLNADGHDIVLKGSSNEFGRLTNQSQNFVIQNITSNKDILFKGNDGGSTITALELDMSAQGYATFAGNVEANSALKVNAPDEGSAPAMTAIMNMHGYEGRGVGIKMKDNVNSASGSTDREWFVGTGYNSNGFNIGYASNGSQTSYPAQSKLIIDTSGNATFAGNVTTGASLVSTNAIVDNVTAKTSNGNITFKTNAGSTIAQFSNALQATFAGEVEAASLDINGNADISSNLTVDGQIVAGGKIQGAELEGTSLDINGRVDFQSISGVGDGTVVRGGFLNPAAEASMVHIPHIINDLAGFQKWSNSTITVTGLYKTRGGSSGSYTYSNAVTESDFSGGQAFDAHSSTAGSWYSNNGADGSTAGVGVITLEWPNELTYSAWAGIVFGSGSFTAPRVKIEAYRGGAWQTLCNITDNNQNVVLRQIAANSGTNNATTKLRYTLGGSVNGSYFRIHTLYAANYRAGDNNLNNTSTAHTQGVNFLEKYKNGYLHGNLYPGADDTYDLGSNSYQWRNGYFDGSVICDGVTVDGNIAVNGTVDGVDISARDSVLSSTTTTAGAALPKAGGTMSGAITGLTSIQTPLITTATNASLKLRPAGSGHLYLGDAGEGFNIYHYNSGADGTYATYNFNGGWYTLQTTQASGVKINDPLDVVGNITVSGTVDGVDIAARDAILTSTKTTADSALQSLNGAVLTTGNQIIAGEKTFSGDLTISQTDSTAPGVMLNLHNVQNGLGTTIRCTDIGAGTSQFGDIIYRHQDSKSYGSAAMFELTSTEATTTILANGKLMFKEGIYSKPASGTGAGTRKDANWDTAYTHSQADHAPANATANSSNATLLARGNHTGTQAYSTITGTPTIPSGNQIIDWTSDQGSTNIHAGNYTDTNTTYTTATSSTLGLVKIGYGENGKNYPVELSSGKMYVNVPWSNTQNANEADASEETKGVVALATDEEIVTGTDTGKATTSRGVKNAIGSLAIGKTGNVTITGTKTFSSTISGSINGNSATTSERTITTGEISAISTNTNKVGITTGSQTISGSKTFSSPIIGQVIGLGSHSSYINKTAAQFATDGTDKVYIGSNNYGWNDARDYATNFVDVDAPVLNQNDAHNGIICPVNLSQVSIMSQVRMNAADSTMQVRVYKMARPTGVNTSNLALTQIATASVSTLNGRMTTLDATGTTAVSAGDLIIVGFGKTSGGNGQKPRINFTLTGTTA